MSKKQIAFTLIELLVVIAIIGILSGFIAVSMKNSVNSANDAKRKAGIDTIRKALTYYGALNGGTYPALSRCTIGGTCSFPNSFLELIPIIPTDPISGNYSYISNGTSFSVSGILSNSQPYIYNSITGFSSGEYPIGNPTFGLIGTDDSQTTQTNPEKTISYPNNDWGFVRTVDAWSGASCGGRWTWDFGSNKQRVLNIKWYGTVTQYGSYCIDTAYLIQASPDNSNWTTMHTITLTNSSTTSTYEDSISGSYRYLRVQLLSTVNCLILPGLLYIDGVWSE
jgi:prepilin-type N-terminal cleavage/methylation domain-containing protein